MSKESDEYERVAKEILHRLRQHWGYESVEGSHDYTGKLTGRNWQIDITAHRAGGQKILIECRRHGRPLDADQVGGYHAKALVDIGADGALMISSSGFQAGAKALADVLKIEMAKLNADATEWEFTLETPDKTFQGVMRDLSTLFKLKAPDEEASSNKAADGLQENNS